MGRRIRRSPIAPLVAFAAATNLGVAGRTVRLDVDPSEELRTALAGFGVRVVADGDADLVLGPDSTLRPADGRVGPGAGDSVAAIEWAREHMPASSAAARDLGDRVRGMRIGIALVVEPKTAVLALLLAEAGAEVHLFAFAAETDDAVAAALSSLGVAVHAAATASPRDERRHALALLDAWPRLLVDDGGHLIRLAHAERPAVVAGLIGATEETTSGVRPLAAMAADGALRIPVIAANDALSKSWSDNRHGTGETCVLAIVRVLDDDLAGAAVAVLGFGPVGEGCATRFAALGAAVTVVDTDPRRALAARFAGFATADAARAVAAADLVVSATGEPGTVDADLLAACREDAAVAVAGGAPEEVRPPRGTRRERLAPHVERLHLPSGGTVRLLAGGDCVNIVAGGGNPIDVMDLSFAVQLAAVRRLVEGSALPPGVHRLGDAADRAVAAAALRMPSGAVAPRAPADWRRTRFDR